ncbi:MAG TPA: mechanosensitive ion channel domain-containing protein [Polyangiaceae bacterium]|nr:mechanosensitive ion channel domain-containing protein [Polyangiaceae bacterium]
MAAAPSRASAVLTEELFRIGDTAVSFVTLGSMALTFVGMLALSWVLRAGLRRALRKGSIEAAGGDLGVADRLIHYGFILVGLTLALHLAGIKLGAVFAAGAVFAVGFGFAMQNIAQNFVSGVILLIERTIKPGDVLEIGTQIVKVMKMSIRATIVRTLDDEDIIVPNSTLVQSNVKNFTLEDNLYRVKVVVGVSYNSDLKLVRDELEQATASVKWRDQAYPPRVLLLNFGDSAVIYETSAWMHDPFNYRLAASDLRETIWVAFKRAGIVIALPQMDVHLAEQPGSGFSATRTPVAR